MKYYTCGLVYEMDQLWECTVETTKEKFELAKSLGFDCGDGGYNFMGQHYWSEQ